MKHLNENDFKEMREFADYLDKIYLKDNNIQFSFAANLLRMAASELSQAQVLRQTLVALVSDDLKDFVKDIIHEEQDREISRD